MYKDFQEATYLPMDVKTDSMSVRGNRTIPLLSTSAARTADGTIVVALANVSLDKEQKVNLSLDGIASKPKTVTGQILSCKSVADYNDFENPNRIVPTEFKDAKLSKQNVSVKIPAKSIAVIKIK
jgi:alpha-L-arabinofuranosidase